MQMNVLLNLVKLAILIFCNGLKLIVVLKINEEMLKVASSNNKLDVLIWLRKNCIDCFTEDVVNEVSKSGHAAILDWFLLVLPKNIKYTTKSIAYASMEGHLNIINWFKNLSILSKKYNFLYDDNSLMLASCYGHVGVLI